MLCPFCYASCKPEYTPGNDTGEVVFECGNCYFEDEPTRYFRGSDCREGEAAIARYKALQDEPE